MTIEQRQKAISANEAPKPKMSIDLEFMEMPSAACPPFVGGE